MKRATAIAAVIAAVLAVSVLSACGSSSPSSPGTPKVPSESTTPNQVVTPSQSATLSGEIWQWALGRNVWDDANLQQYTRDLGRSSDTDVNVQSEGFKLTPDSSGTVTSVTLFNDENALGYPGSETNFRAYQGTLPAGLSWNDTATDLQAVYGAPSQSGGFGTDITFTYTTKDGYRIEVDFAARHEQDLPDSPIHCIKVSRV